MAQFQVPQFIETEDKIIGPLTLRQFIYLAVTGSLSGFSFVIFETFLAFIFSAILMGMGAGLAFIKVNGRTMPFFIKAAFKYLWRPKVYVFKLKKETGESIRAERERALSDSHNAESGLRSLGDKLLASKTALSKREQALPPQGQAQRETVEKYEVVREMSGAKEAARRIDYR